MTVHFRAILLILIFIGIIPAIAVADTVMPSHLVSITQHSCSQQQAVLLVPGYGVTTEFMEYLASQFDGINGHACFSDVYGVNYRNNGDDALGLGGIRDVKASVENEILGWATDIAEAITWLSTQAYDKKPAIVAWSSGEIASFTWLYDQVYLNNQTSPVSIISVINGVPTINTQWLGREKMWPVALTALQPLIYDNAGACLIDFLPSIWSLFLYSTTETALAQKGMTTSATFLDKTIPSPEGVVYDMTGLGRSDFDRGQSVNDCRPKKFVYDEYLGKTIPSTPISLPADLFEKTKVPVLFTWSTKDIIITAGTTKSQFDYYCTNISAANCAITEIVGAPHGGLVSAEWEVEDGESVASNISQKINTFVLNTSSARFYKPTH